MAELIPSNAHLDFAPWMCGDELVWNALLDALAEADMQIVAQSKLKHQGEPYEIRLHLRGDAFDGALYAEVEENYRNKTVTCTLGEYE